jgi:hypothetical protein
MLPTNRSSRTWLRRIGLEPTRTGPEPRTAPATMIIHRVPLAEPLPKGELLVFGQGAPAPDRGRTEAWPHGEVTGAP